MFLVQSPRLIGCYKCTRKLRRKDTFHQGMSVIFFLHNRNEIKKHLFLDTFFVIKSFYLMFILIDLTRDNGARRGSA